MKWLLFALCLGWSSLTFATEYFVGGAGASDSNPGTAAQPFATIQKAASVARAGDIVNIRGGIYRETITPASSGAGGSPITFRPDNGASVVISGLNVVGNDGWTLHSGSIYKKSITLPLQGYASNITSTTTLLANQVFKGGDMMIEARWPDGVQTKDDLLKLSATGPATGTRRYASQFGGFNATSLTDPTLPLPSGQLTGATLISTGWFITESRTVTHSGSTLTFPAIWSNSVGPQIRKYYYLTGKLGLLNQAREWHYEGGTLYLWQPGGGSPTDVEYKARNWGFDLRGKTYIVIQGLTFIGCDPATGDAGTSYCTIDNIRASYMNHTVRHDRVVWQGYGNSQLVGTKLAGTNNVFKK